MRELTQDDIRSALACPTLTERERAVFRQFYVRRLRTHVIAERLGVSRGCVTAHLSVARSKAFGSAQKMQPVKRMKQDFGWFKRQVDYLRQLADAEHQGRYLNGIAFCWGEEERKRVEAAI